MVQGRWCKGGFVVYMRWCFVREVAWCKGPCVVVMQVVWLKGRQCVVRNVV